MLLLKLPGIQQIWYKFIKIKKLSKILNSSKFKQRKGRDREREVDREEEKEREKRGIERE